MRNREIESLLRHSEFLKALARSILKDPARADDVVQETWLAALKATTRPQRLHRGWLAGILQNLARRAIRDESRRAQRERAITQERYAPPTDDLWTKQASLRRIATLVARLPDTYRVPIVLRYHEGLDTGAIATRLGIARSTVRTRLQRGLERLRGLLREDKAGPPRCILPFLLGVPRPRPPRKPFLASYRLVAAGLVAIALTGIVLRQGNRSSGVRAPALFMGRAAVDAPDAQDRKKGTRTRAGVGGPPAVEIAPAALQAAQVLRGRVDLGFAASTSTVTLEVGAASQSEATSDRIRTTVSAGTTFEVPVDRLCRRGMPSAFVIEASHPEAVSVQTRVAVLWFPQTRRPHIPAVDLQLSHALRLRGTVETRAGDPVPNVRVLAFPYAGDRPVWPARADSVSDTNGRFVLRVEKAGLYCVLAVPPHRAPVAQSARAAIESAPDPIRLVLAPGQSAGGSVRGPHGDGLADARLRVRAVQPAGGVPLVLPGLSEAIVWEGGRVAWLARDARTDAKGCFLVPGLSSDPYRVDLVSIPSGDAELLREDPSRFCRTVCPPATLAFEVAPGRVHVRVEPESMPLRGTQVAAFRTDGSGSVIRARRTNREFALDLVPGAAYTVQVSRRGCETCARTLRAPGAGQLETLSMEPGPCTRTARLVTKLSAPPGLAVPGVWLFRFEPLDGGQALELTATIHGDRFELDDLPSGRFQVEAIPGGVEASSGHVLPAHATVTLFTGKTAQVLLPVEAAGRLVVDVTTPDSETCSRVDCWVESASGERYPLAHPRRRHYRSPPLRPGPYTLRVRLASSPGIGASQRVLVRGRETTSITVNLQASVAPSLADSQPAGR